MLRDPVSRARLEWAISRTYAEHGQVDLAERYARRVVSALACGEHLLLLGRSHVLLGSILLDRSRLAEADAELGRASEALERGGAPGPELALLDYERGRSALLDGRLDDADRLARAGLGRTEATEPGTAGMLYTLLAKIALERDELDEARRLCHEAAGVLTGTVAVHYLDDVWQTLADIEERAGDLPAALAALRRVTAGRRTTARRPDGGGQPWAGWTTTPGTRGRSSTRRSQSSIPRVAAVQRQVLGQDPVERARRRRRAARGRT